MLKIMTTCVETLPGLANMYPCNKQSCSDSAHLGLTLMPFSAVTAIWTKFIHTTVASCDKSELRMDGSTSYICTSLTGTALYLSIGLTACSPETLM